MNGLIDVLATRTPIAALQTIESGSPALSVILGGNRPGSPRFLNSLAEFRDAPGHATFVRA
jgi:hypothetical protein